MANSNFVVQNGLTVGPLTIDAITGSISTSGTVSTAAGAVTPNQIYQGSSNITVSGTLVNVAITGTNVASFSSTGLQVNGNLTVTGTTTFYNTETVSGVEVVAGNLVANSGTDTTSTTTGALVLTGSGGAAIGGNLYVGNNLYVGPASFNTPLTTPTVTAVDNGSSYAQMAILNSATTGSADIVAYGSNYPGPANDHGWGDLGFTGPGFNDPNYTITKANDAYLFGSAVAGAGGGNLVLATDWTGSFNDIVIGAGSFHANAEVARFHGNATTSGYLALLQGTAATNTTSGALRVSGGVGVTGAIYAGSLQNTPIGSTTASTGAFTQLFGQSVNATTGFATANAVITGGSITGATIGAGTAVVTNFSSGNAVITGGSITGAIIGATTAVVTNFSTGNAVITGGSITGATIGAGTAVVTNFSSGNTKINGSDSTGTQTGALQVTGGIGVSGNLWIGGNLYVSNIFSVTTNTLTVNDPLVYFVATPSPYNFDIGFYSDFVGGPVNAYGHSGVVRQQSANVWVFFSNVQSEPTTTNINWNDAGIIYDTVKMGAVILANATGTTLSGTTGLLTNFSTGNAVITGGSITGATIGAGTAVVTNFSSGNAVITGGYSDNHPIGANTKATGAFTTITGTGNVAITNTVYTNGLYDSGNRVLSTSTGAGNLSISSTAVTLPATGPGAATTGSSTAIPVVTTDAYGRVAGITTAAVVAPAGTLSGTTLAAGVTASSLTSVGTLGALTVTATITGSVSGSSGNSPAGSLTGTTLAAGVTASSLTSVGTLTGLTVSGAIVPNANVSVNLGSTTAWWNIIYGKATQAQYADLAENYQADKTYPTGTVLMFGGDAEVTVADADTTRVAGVVSTNPAHLMNGGLTGPHVTALALTGRVPTMVIGPVQKGDIMVSAGWGYAKVNNTPQVGTIIGKALQDYPYENKGMIEVVVGRF